MWVCWGLVQVFSDVFTRRTYHNSQNYIYAFLGSLILKVHTCKCIMTLSKLTKINFEGILGSCKSGRYS